MKNERILFCRQDLYIIGCALLMAAAAFLIYNLSHTGAGKTVQITVDGSLCCEYPLDTDRIQTVTGYNGGSCTVVVEGGKVYFSEATCPDKLCVRHAAVSHAGECIICLPGRIIALITAENGKDETDGISR